MIKKITLVLCALVALLIFGVVMLCLWLNQQAPKEIEAAKQRLHEMGAPMTLEEALLLAVPDEKNAAPLYLELVDFSEKTSAVAEADDLLEQQVFGEYYDKDWEYILRFELRDEEWGVLEEAVEMLEQVGYFERIEAITVCSYFRPDWDFEQGPAMLIPEITPAREAGRWCLARAFLRMRANQPVAALADLKGAYVLSDQMAQGQTLINALISCAIRLMANKSLETMSREGYDLSMLDSSVWDFSMMSHWLPALDLERLGMGRVVFETLLYGSDEERMTLLQGESRAMHTIGTLGLIRWFFEYDYATYLNLMADVRGQVGFSPAELKAADAELQEQMLEAKRNYRILTCILMPTTYHVQMRMTQCEARDRLAQTGLALSAYHAEHNSYPHSLSDLVPSYLSELQLDPFSEAPLVYQWLEGGYQLYSVGVNGLDEGGVERVDADIDEGDLIWTGAGSVLKRIDLLQ
ncbi:MULTISPECIES: hypothetical protein [unclassified Lentimonas]|uniref:hypothetical protein n=1 Tax=unclassified Lentimonas TaxID=2630993 RepID=UPI001320E663|nr:MULTISPECIES: hypothetical protein [unclassified Lentimonas]CAA6676560.1 Unannotated [Lentimonas sp. CC4]CAA6684776.1 Unannotated [Lentimonas sp. CC6]CAA7075412.1 Unannotated [Lentimonas sp. CC4]CAA7168925.1 Unannotated [Lentimonas sp. CC21]CAA7182179.1 Unannotated [Lentimonas sp. CC8]